MSPWLHYPVDNTPPDGFCSLEWSTYCCSQIVLLKRLLVLVMLFLPLYFAPDVYASSRALQLIVALLLIMLVFALSLLDISLAGDNTPLQTLQLLRVTCNMPVLHVMWPAGLPSPVFSSLYSPIVVICYDIILKSCFWFKLITFMLYICYVFSNLQELVIMSIIITKKIRSLR